MVEIGKREGYKITQEREKRKKSNKENHVLVSTKPITPIRVIYNFSYIHHSSEI